MQLHILAIVVILLVAVVGFIVIGIYSFYAEQRRERLRLLNTQRMMQMETMAASQAILRAYMNATKKGGGG